MKRTDIPWSPTLPRSRARRAMPLIPLAATLFLSGCLGAGTPLPVTDLDGAYSGELLRTLNSREACPIRRQIRITIRAGEMRGEVVNAEGADRSVERFAAFLEGSGAVVAPIRVGNLVFSLEGRLDGRTFRGEARHDYCTMSVFARRSDSA